MNDTSSRSHAVFTICLRRFIKGTTLESTVEKISRFRSPHHPLRAKLTVDWSIWREVKERVRRVQQGLVSEREAT